MFNKNHFLIIYDINTFQFNITNKESIPQRLKVSTQAHILLHYQDCMFPKFALQAPNNQHI